MATILATLGLFRVGTTDYSAGRSRTLGSWHMVRKQYGDDSATFNYARFVGPTAYADYLAARADPSLASWQSDPYSEYEYTLLLLPLSSPLPTSTAAAGAVVVSGGSTDVTPVVSAIGAGNAILTSMLAGQSAPGGRSTETTQLKILAALASLSVTGQVAITNPNLTVLGPLTDTQLRASAIAVSLAAIPLAAGAANTAGQLTGNTSLASIDTKLTSVATANGQADQLAKLEALRLLLASTSTAALQTSGNQLLTNILAALTAPALASHASTDTLQVASNTVLGNILTVLGTGATAAGQQAQLSDLDAIKASAAAGATAALQTALNGLVATSSKQDTGNTTLASILQALGPAATATLQTAANALLQTIATSVAAGATASKQDAGNTALVAIQGSTAASATSAKQDAGNALLANLVQALGPAATAALQTAGNTLLQAIANSVAAGATAARQDTGNNTLAAIQTNTAMGATAAGQTTLASKQDTANGYLQTLVQNGIATTAGPATPYSLVTLQGSNATTVRAGATWMLGGTVANTATAYRYLFLYNLAAAPANNAALPTTAATGLVRTIAVPPNSSVSLNLPAGRYTAFSAGLTIAAAAGSTLSTVTSAAAGLTAGIGLTAGDLVINIDFSN